jgi:tetratricopeptide (TPR) repeat protein
MNRLRALRCLIVVTGLVAASPAHGSEPAQAFLDGLRERGYFDTAADYLDTALDSPLVPGKFKQTALYEKGLILVLGASHERDLAIQETQLNEGQQALQQFVTDQPSHLLATAARSQLGNVLVKRAGIRVERARRMAPAQKQAETKAALVMYDDAAKIFAALVTELAERKKKFSAAIDEKTDPELAAQRDRVRTDYLQAQIFAAATQEEKAMAFDAGSKEQIEALTKASDGYKTVYEEYRTRMAGLYAHMYQGRCLHKLGKYKDASSIFTHLLDNPDTPEFRPLRVKVMPLAVEAWFDQQLHLEIVNQAVPFIDALRPGEDRTDDVMQMRLTTARACKAYADELAAANPRDAQIKSLLAEGRKQATFVSRLPNFHQDAARRLLPEFASGDDPAERPEPKNFDEALATARGAVTDMQEAEQLAAKLAGQIAAEQTAAKRNELQQQLSETERNVARLQQDAYQLSRLALHLADERSSLDAVNLMRYLLCFFEYQRSNFHDSAVLGEFLARRYPSSQGARHCAKIAMVSYLKLYDEASAQDNAFETRQIIDICDYITRQWPDQEETNDALNTLIPFMIRERKLQEAEDYLSKIPQDSPHRGSAELKTGQALWANYLESSQQIRAWETGTQQKPDDTDLAARKQDLEQLKTRAKKTLVDGVERMRAAGDSGEMIATAVLALTQIYVDTGEPAKAVALLEDARFGLLTLLKAKDPTVTQGRFPEETYKVALRAYVTTLAGASDPSATIDKAKGIMASLKEHMGQTPAGKQQMVGIYVSLARDLQRQMEIAEPQTKGVLGDGFEEFLTSVAEDADELDILYWVAETYRGMGEAFVVGPGQALPKQADGYFEKAARAYQKILDRGKREPGFVSPSMATQIRLQVAKTRRARLEFKEAMDIFETILKANPTMLPVQVEAARTYQDWGGRPGAGMEQNYVRAMLGARPDATATDPKLRTRNVIWGWSEISNRTARDVQFRDVFHESRFNLALCRYNYAVTLKDAAKKSETLRRCVQDVNVTMSLYSKTVEEKWKTQYDTLLKNVQKALGEPPLGLKALEDKSPAPAEAASAAPPAKTVPIKTKTAAAASQK